MNWKTHKAITRAVCSKFDIRVAEDIANASILPDKEPDYRYGERVRHPDMRL